MGQVIDFWSAQELRPSISAETKCRCTNCGADLWHICSDGEICCADCDAPCPYRLQRRDEG
jgi:hypothetical protein